MYFWLGLRCCAGFSLVAESGSYSLAAMHGLLVAVTSRIAEYRLQDRHMGFSRCGSQTLELRLNSCGTWAQLLRGMQDLPGSGIEPTSLVSAHRLSLDYQGSLVLALLTKTLESSSLQIEDGNFPGGPVAKTPFFQHSSLGLIPGQGTSSHMLLLRPRAAKSINKNKH